MAGHVASIVREQTERSELRGHRACLQCKKNPSKAELGLKLRISRSSLLDFSPAPE